MKNYLSVRLLLPFIIFLLIFIFLWRGLTLHPNEIPSPFINKNTPDFYLPTLFDPHRLTSNQDFLGHVTLLNVWATWCAACAEEHELLVQLAQKEHLIIFGLNYKDDPSLAKKWLQEHGNPYQLVAIDLSGKAAINWGVYGTPETFIIDKNGIVRYKQIGVITPDSWEQNLKPLIQRLQNETP